MVGTTLDQIRATYLDHFASRAAEMAKECDNVIVESAFRDKDGALVREGPLSLPLRSDLLLLQDGEVRASKQIGSKATFLFEPVTFDWEGDLEVELAPFQWDACDVKIIGVASRLDWGPLVDWFMRWFDSADEKKRDERGFSGVVHYLSDPKAKTTSATLSVDFGSAPVQAFEEFLDTFKKLGASKVQIGNRVTEAE